MNVTVTDIKALAEGQVPDLARMLAPGGRVNGGYWVTKSPLRPDRVPGSFIVWIKGSGAGAWKDYATGDKGDLIDLIARTLYGGDDRAARGSAIMWLKSRLGLADGAPAQAAGVAARLHQAKKIYAAKAAAEGDALAQRQARAFHLWSAGRQMRGSLGEVYLRSRGIDAGNIANLAPGFRFAADLDYWRLPGTWRGPAMLTRYVDDTGFRALHATWLARDGQGKAPVAPAKLSLASYAGSVLELTFGDSGLKFAEPGQKAAPLLLAEGIEDGLTGAMARPDLRVWAAGSLSNLGNVPLPDCVSEIWLLRQNDKGGAVEGFERAAHKLRQRAGGRPVREILTAIGKDINDQLRSKV